MDPKVDIGRRIKEFRRRHNLTLKQVEAKVDLSATHISEIERGKTSPTVGALSKIARAFEIDPALFVTSEALPDAVVQRKADRRRMEIPREGVVLECISGGIEAPEMSLLVVEWAPGCAPQPHRPHEGEELGLILEGSLEVHLDNRSFTVGAGESIHFRAGLPHRIANPGDEPCRAIWATVPRFSF